jgi:hypothetical protein
VILDWPFEPFSAFAQFKQNLKKTFPSKKEEQDEEDYFEGAQWALLE